MKFSEVQRAISTIETVRQQVIARYRALGGTVEWQQQDMVHMANALTWAEDCLEYTDSRAAKVLKTREEMRAVRRKLEDYLNERDFEWGVQNHPNPTSFASRQEWSSRR
jgi:hypothetical protein